VKKIVLLILVTSFLLSNISIGLGEIQYYITDRGDNFKVLYIDTVISIFELENIINTIIENKTQFYVREREYTIDIYIERKYWMTIRYDIHTGLKIIRR
jgi:hypothetical protein